jgi:hypothetical protein
MTEKDRAFGKRQLKKVMASGRTAKSREFGERWAGFSAERVVDRWLKEQKIRHVWNKDPNDPKQDFEFGETLVDLKTHVTMGNPKGDYDANLTEKQRRGSSPRDWYLFAKLSKANLTDLWVLGFQTEEVIMSKGVFYREGEITRKDMAAPVDCWCIAYEELIKPFDWLGEYK